MEGWVDIMYQLMDATGWYATPMIFVAMIVLGSFFLLNLTLAVLGDNFDKMMLLEEQKNTSIARMEALKVSLFIYRYMLCNSCSQFDSLPWKDIRMHCLQ